MVGRWFCLLVTGGVLSGFAFLLVTGRYANDGPVVLPLTLEHGLHAGDVFVIGGWAAALLALRKLAPTAATGDPAPPARRGAGDATDPSG